MNAITKSLKFLRVLSSWFILFLPPSVIGGKYSGISLILSLWGIVQKSVFEFLLIECFSTISVEVGSIAFTELILLKPIQEFSFKIDQTLISIVSFTF